jgi:hypothetical protein
MPYAKNTTYFERREKAYTLNARNTTKERLEKVIHRNL